MFTDMNGRPIAGGDTVAFAALSYKRAHLRIGKVLDTRKRGAWTRKQDAETGVWSSVFEVDHVPEIQVLNESAGRREWRTPGEVLVVQVAEPSPC